MVLQEAVGNRVYTDPSEADLYVAIPVATWYVLPKKRPSFAQQARHYSIIPGAEAGTGAGRRPQRIVIVLRLKSKD
jgi:hypothetical protein